MVSPYKQESGSLPTVSAIKSGQGNDGAPTSAQSFTRTKPTTAAAEDTSFIFQEYQRVKKELIDSTATVEEYELKITSLKQKIKEQSKELSERSDLVMDLETQLETYRGSVENMEQERKNLVDALANKATLEEEIQRKNVELAELREAVRNHEMDEDEDQQRCRHYAIECRLKTTDLQVRLEDSEENVTMLQQEKLRMQQDFDKVINILEAYRKNQKDNVKKLQRVTSCMNGDKFLELCDTFDTTSNSSEMFESLETHVNKILVLLKERITEWRRMDKERLEKVTEDYLRKMFQREAEKVKNFLRAESSSVLNVKMRKESTQVKTVNKSTSVTLAKPHSMSDHTPKIKVAKKLKQREYICEFCSKMFYTSAVLQQHLLHKHDKKVQVRRQVKSVGEKPTAVNRSTKPKDSMAMTAAIDSVATGFQMTCKEKRKKCPRGRLKNSKVLQQKEKAETSGDDADKQPRRTRTRKKTVRFQSVSTLKEQLCKQFSSVNSDRPNAAAISPKITKSSSHKQTSSTSCSCGDTFKTTSNLRNHIRQRNKPEKLQCPFCPKKFTFNWHLNRHLHRTAGHTSSSSAKTTTEEISHESSTNSELELEPGTSQKEVPEMQNELPELHPNDTGRKDFSVCSMQGQPSDCESDPPKVDNDNDSFEVPGNVAMETEQQQTWEGEEDKDIVPGQG